MNYMVHREFSHSSYTLGGELVQGTFSGALWTFNNYLRNSLFVIWYNYKKFLYKKKGKGTGI